jgi:hypothetical protein
MSDPQRYNLTVEALPDDTVPASVRLRRWLKTGLRQCRVRCLAITPTDGGELPETIIGEMVRQTDQLDGRRKGRLVDAMAGIEVNRPHIGPCGDETGDQRERLRGGSIGGHANTSQAGRKSLPDSGIAEPEREHSTSNGGHTNTCKDCHKPLADKGIREIVQRHGSDDHGDERGRSSEVTR